MSVRTAELVMAITLALLSIVFMVKGLDGLSIWWVPEKGPGSGVWPFWLSFLMLLSCLTIIYRWFVRATPQSRSDEPFMDRHAVQVLGVTVGALFMLILGTAYIGIYFSLFLFLFFSIKIQGGHSWPLSLRLTAAIPLGVFLLFEYALTIPLPKGLFEELYYPLYKIMYARGLGIWGYVLPLLFACATIAAPHYLRFMKKEGALLPGLDRGAVWAISEIALLVLLLFGVRYLGAYVSLFLFVFVYLKALARQSWLIALVAAVAVPLALFLVFELALGMRFPMGATASLFAP